MSAVICKSEVRAFAAVSQCLAVMCLASCSSDCRPQPTAASMPTAQMTSNQAEECLDALYKRYLQGSPDEARTCLVEAEKCLDALQEGKNWAKFLQHARLHCLAKARDNEEEAYLEFVQAQYWWLMVNRSSLSQTDLATKLRVFTERECDRMVIELDRANSKEGAAQYWRSLPAGAISPDEWLRLRYGE
jgi:hypothetical protein